MQRDPAATWAITTSAVLFSLLTVAFQVKELGISYLEEGVQIQRHLNVLRGSAIDPWQYRVLSEYVVEGFLFITRSLGLPHPVATGFILFRVFQNALLFILAAVYYGKLGLKTYPSLLGLSLLAWGMTHSVYNSDLQFSTYFEVTFYLLAVLAILQERLWWIPLITVAAALNRESSLLIPFLTLATPRSGEREEVRGKYFVGAISVTLAAATLYGLRLYYGPRPPGFTPPPGLPLLEYNLFRIQSWVYLFGTLGLLPIMAIVSMPRWPSVLKAFFWILVPVWFSVHLFAGVIAETRLFLVPQTLIFVPGALLGIAALNQREA
jgi:hypothetical protein